MVFGKGSVGEICNNDKNYDKSINYPLKMFID